MRKRSIPIRAVLYRDQADWIAHCLEFDVCGIGATVEESIQSLSDAIASQIEFSVNAGNARNLFNPAPSEFFEMFASGKTKVVGKIDLHFPGFEIESLDAREYDDDNSATDHSLACV